MDRITDKHLKVMVDSINKAAGTPLTPYSEAPGKFHANPNNYHLDYAYGGVQLVQMCNEGGGVRTISNGGFGTKRDLYNQLRAFLSGVEAGKEV